MESVSHHILPQMLVSPLWVDLNNLLKDYLKFMDDHFRESADLTFLAYRHRNYSKVRTNFFVYFFLGPTLLHITCVTWFKDLLEVIGLLFYFIYVLLLYILDKVWFVSICFSSMFLLLKCLQELSQKSFRVYTFVSAAFLSALRV